MAGTHHWTSSNPFQMWGCWAFEGSMIMHQMMHFNHPLGFTGLQVLRTHLDHLNVVLVDLRGLFPHRIWMFQNCDWRCWCLHVDSSLGYNVNLWLFRWGLFCYYYRQWHSVLGRLSHSLALDGPNLSLLDLLALIFWTQHPPMQWTHFSTSNSHAHLRWAAEVLMVACSHMTSARTLPPIQDNIDLFFMTRWHDALYLSIPDVRNGILLSLGSVWAHAHLSAVQVTLYMGNILIPHISTTIHICCTSLIYTIMTILHIQQLS